jgi:septum site-determining protein MinC
MCELKMRDEYMIMEKQLFQTVEKSFRFKASFSPCLIIEILRNDLDNLQSDLIEMANRTPKFFKGSPVAIDLNKLNISQALDFERLKTLLLSQGMIPVGIRGGDQKQQEAAALAGLPYSNANRSSGGEANQKKQSDQSDQGDQDNYRQENNQSNSSDSSNSNNPNNQSNQSNSSSENKSFSPAETTKLITAPIRSGMQVCAKDGDLIVTSQVSSGAELIAAGHIHVYGVLRGRVLAGAYGNKEARIFCRHLEAELVAISGYYLTREDMLPRLAPGSMIQIYLENEKIHIKAI